MFIIFFSQTKITINRHADSLVRLEEQNKTKRERERETKTEMAWVLIKHVAALLKRMVHVVKLLLKRMVPVVKLYARRMWNKIAGKKDKIAGQACCDKYSSVCVFCTLKCFL